MTIEQDSTPFSQNSQQTEVPHAGLPGVPDDVREVPVDGAPKLTSDTNLEVPEFPPSDDKVAQQAQEAIANRRAAETTNHRGRNILVGFVALAASVGATLGIVKATGGNNDADKVPLNTEPTVSAPAVPGQTETEATQETGTGITLTAEQVADLQSGDLERSSKVMNEVLLDPMSLAAARYMEGTTPSVDVSAVSDNERLAEFIQNWADGFKPYDGQDTSMGQTVTICEANIADPASVGSGCEGDFTTLELGKPIIIKGMRVSADDMSGLNDANTFGLDSTRDDGSYLTPVLQGDTLSVVTVQS